MRPAILNPLFAAASGIKGIGRKLDRTLARFLRPDRAEDGLARIVDLLFHLPSGLVDRRFRPQIADLPRTGIVTVEVTVGRHRVPPPLSTRTPYRVEAFDDTGRLTLVFFHAHGEHLRRILPEGERRFVSGSIDWYGGEPQIVHPDHIVTAEEFEGLPLIEPVYPLTEGLSGKVLVKAIRAALDRIPALPEWQDEAYRQRHNWPPFGVALRALHHPETPAAFGPDAPARCRLAYDELLANQLALSLVRRHMKRASGRSLTGTGDRRARIAAALPYSLTASQRQAVGEILQDMAKPQRMLRLLQGDVGSGKTVVALLALATAVECGAQGAFMVPTEILARQHLSTLSPYCQAAGIRLALLTGREKGKAREEVLAGLASGEIGILIGTHALFQEGVAFKDLALVVIDEQHRFGVHQRLALQAKAGTATDHLVMTATPIPRTLALTVYGDMDVSKLTEKPAGRLPIDTRVLPMSRLDEVVAGLGRSLAEGHRAYWVCPLVEESEAVDLAAAEDRFRALAARFPGRVGLIHGRLKGSERDRAMAAFKSGVLSLLVSTTVIEVGVDVPEANVMVVENAERFGLAQLHQLRGRVGRGAAKSVCLLLYQNPIGETARARLRIMRDTDDGFRIAEEDLRLRGAGEMLGTRQAGLPLFRIADLGHDGELLAAARDDAALVLARDDRLMSPRGEALRVLLYLFERDEAVRLISAG
jgi:ATP-dependent DNA helicase RecG